MLDSADPGVCSDLNGVLLFGLESADLLGGLFLAGSHGLVNSRTNDMDLNALYLLEVLLADLLPLDGHLFLGRLRLCYLDRREILDLGRTRGCRSRRIYIRSRLRLRFRFRLRIDRFRR